MTRAKRLSVWITVVVCIAVVLGGVLFRSHKSKTWKELNIFTATRGGTYDKIGAQLARILELHPESRITTVTATQSSGSIENIRNLMRAEHRTVPAIALVQKPALVKAIKNADEQLCVLARLYTDCVQILVRSDAGIDELTATSLQNKNVYPGDKESGTSFVAHLIVNGIGAKGYTPMAAKNYADAARKLDAGLLHAAIFVAGKPTEAVRDALTSGNCRLIGLNEELIQQLVNDDLKPVSIPAHCYNNQPESIETVGADVYLVCRKDLDADLAFHIVDTLFHSIPDLLLEHTVAQDIKLTRAFETPEGFELHPGAQRFAEREQKTLLIATGAINGKYYNTGKVIQRLLLDRGIQARVSHTDGSLENLDLLRGERPVIALMQYDAALASRFRELHPVYGVDLSDKGIRVPEVPDLRRIATLHEEKVHVLIRRQKLRDIATSSGVNVDSPTTISSLRQLAEAIGKLTAKGEKIDMKICCGPERSATKIVAQALLKLYGLEQFPPTFLSVPDMVRRMQTDEIDLGFFVSFTPSEAMKAVLHNPNHKLLSVGAVEMTNRIFVTSTIAGTYACQKEDEPAVRTISTRAVLVAREKAPCKIRAITEAVFDGEALLAVEGGRKAMAEDLRSLPLHPDANRYYKKAGLLDTKPPFDWVHVTWRVLAILVILAGGYRGALALRRQRTANRIGRQILAVPLEGEYEHSAERLLTIRGEIRERVRRRWWRWGELDKPRWRRLNDLIGDQLTQARANLVNSLVVEIRSLTPFPDTGEDESAQHYRAIEHRIWKYFEGGELDPPQHCMLIDLLEKCREHATETVAGRNEKDQQSAPDVDDTVACPS